MDKTEESCKTCVDWSGRGFDLTYAMCDRHLEDVSYMNWCHEYIRGE